MRKNLELVKERDFSEVLTLRQQGRSRAFSAINVALIETYWAVGSYLSRKVTDAGWGKGVILGDRPECRYCSGDSLGTMRAKLLELNPASSGF